MPNTQQQQNDRQEIFVQELVKGSSQRQAYYAAYPNSKKWKPESVDSKASNLLKNPKVAARLQELRDQAEKENELTRDGILAQLKKIGFVDVNTNRIRPADKIKALEVIAKIMGYDKIEISMESIEDLTPIADLISRAKERGE